MKAASGYAFGISCVMLRQECRKKAEVLDVTQQSYRVLCTDIVWLRKPQSITFHVQAHCLMRLRYISASNVFENIGTSGS